MKPFTNYPLNSIRDSMRCLIPPNLTNFERKLWKFRYLNELKKTNPRIDPPPVKLLRELKIRLSHPVTGRIINIRFLNKEYLNKTIKSKIKDRLLRFINRLYFLNKSKRYEEFDEVLFKYNLFIAGKDVLLKRLRFNETRNIVQVCYCNTCKKCVRRIIYKAKRNCWKERLEDNFYTEAQLRSVEDSEKEILIDA